MRKTSKTFTATLLISLCTALTAQAAPPALDPPAVQKPAATAVAATPAVPAVAPAVPAVKPGAPVVTPVTAPAPAVAVPAKSTPAASAPATPASPVAPPAVAVKNEKTPSIPSPVLERFRTYTGQRTPAALIALFNAPVLSTVRQMPEIVLSDGAVPVNIAMALPAKDSSAPNFAFNSARLLASTQLKKDEWLLEVLPETGTMKAEMIVLANGSTTEIPLTVAPPLSAGTDLSEKAFIAFLGGAKPAEKPLQDLNGDGRRDYVDDYIFAANYLVNKRTPFADPATAEKEPRTAQTPIQSDPELVQRLLDQEAKGAASAAEKASEAPLTFGGGGSFASGSSAPASSGASGYNSTTTTAPPATGDTTGGTTGNTAGGTTGGTTGGTKSTMTTITSPSGKSLTYIGTDKRNLNLRNLKAKEQKEQLNSTSR